LSGDPLGALDVFRKKMAAPNPNGESLAIGDRLYFHLRL